LRMSGATSIAAALRYHGRRPSQPLRTIMNCSTALPGPYSTVHRRSRQVITPSR
jgi:hypothetical protein